MQTKQYHSAEIEIEGITHALRVSQSSPERSNCKQATLQCEFWAYDAWLRCGHVLGEMSDDDALDRGIALAFEKSQDYRCERSCMRSGW